MGGAPGLYALLGDGVALGQIVQLLIGILHVDDLAQTVADGGLEGILDLMLDDEDHGLKAGAAGVVDGVVNDELIVVANRVHLLKSAVAAAHTGGHDNEDRFGLHNLHSPNICRGGIHPPGYSAAAAAYLRSGQDRSLQSTRKRHSVGRGLDPPGRVPRR